MMGWFSKKEYTPEVDYEPTWPPRSASVDFVEGLKEVASVYDARAKDLRDGIGQRCAQVASEVAKHELYYEGRVESALRDMQSMWDRLQPIQSAADEIREWINRYENQGERPSYLPPLPPDPTPHQSGE